MSTVTAPHVIATYIIETSLPLEHAAEVLAGEQSTGTFVRVERESDDLRARFAAQAITPVATNHTAITASTGRT